MGNVENRNVTDFFDKEFLDYANYVVEHRAIPSVIDGLKPTQRKIIYIANKIWKTGTERQMKVFQLGGKVAADAMYHHGDASLNAAIIGLAQSFKNSMPLLKDINQFGSLRSPQAGAPRYIDTKLHENFRYLYKDFELLTPQYDDGYEIEPKYFLPIVPAVLLNGGSGIAIGFATDILNRNPIDLIDACINYLNDKKFKTLLPWWNNYIGDVIEKDDRYYAYGKMDIVNSTTVNITELPPSMTYEKYEAHLNKLLESRYITYYEDNCSKSISYTVKFRREDLSKYQQDMHQFLSKMKLVESYTENLTCLDEHGKLKIFNNVEEIIKYFVDFRLTYYDKRKKYIIAQLERELKILNNRARFIKSIIENKIKINNRQKTDIINDLIAMKFDMVDDSYSYLLSMAIYSLTKEVYEEILKKEVEKKKELESSKNLVPKDMYMEDLNELKKTVKKTK